MARPNRKRRLTYRGHNLDSGLELDIIKNLYSDKRKLKNGFNFEHETELLPYFIEGEYKPDFIIHRSDGSKVYVEAKGRLDEQARRKMVAVRKCHPDKDIRFIFYSNGKIRKNARMRLLEWAEKIGFNGAVVGNRVPVEWLLPDLENNKNNA